MYLDKHKYVYEGVEHKVVYYTPKVGSNYIKYIDVSIDKERKIIFVGRYPNTIDINTESVEKTIINKFNDKKSKKVYWLSLSNSMNVFLFGNEYNLRINFTNKHKNELVLDQETMIATLILNKNYEHKPVNLYKKVIEILNEKLSTYIDYLHSIYTKKMGLEKPKTSIKNYVRSYWGKCTYFMGILECIRYNLSLICLPPKLIESVVLHELSHVKTKSGHDDKFYSLFYSLDENLKQYEEELESLDVVITQSFE
ncbi:DUF45 domain-containing protein [Mycoplasmopsis mucosicanis]|uniref:DUF45 domain-containing protein n=1 Tax=Mycoplasmopsis mucosicanis TaxID=458208 RepID=A0A507SHX3_9BACT|nr:YgjP-like metallopeptidase domain-containing protein [Mycoplasmopsis mucosicanis]TQC51360.1 DUF45 domain-containing protein [Mycoplasmopsis mucosicanis]